MYEFMKNNSRPMKKVSPLGGMKFLINWRIHCYFGKIKGEFFSFRTMSLFWDRLENFFRIHNILVISKSSVETLLTWIQNFPMLNCWQSRQELK